MVSFESNPPFSVEDFLSECQRLLSEDDFTKLSSICTADGMNEDVVDQILAEIKANPGLESKTFYKLVSFLRRFHNETAHFRAARASKDPEKFMRGEYYSDPAVYSIIQEAAKYDNPLETEKALDKLCWQTFDDLTSAHFFDFETVLAYGLKIKILNKYKEIQSPQGREMLESFKKIEV